MPTSKKKRHGSGKVYKPKPIRYDPRYTDKVTTQELRSALTSSLTFPQLAELEKQIRKFLEDNCQLAMEHAYKAMWAIALRVLHDQFGFDEDQKQRLWDSSVEYLYDIEQGRIDLNEMMETLEYEDNVVFHWTDKEASELLDKQVELE